jgi:hypothetical protein
MTTPKTIYLITIGEGELDNDGVIADEFEETLIYVGRLIERLHMDEKFTGKYIYVTEYIKDTQDNEKYIKQDNLFSGKYLIEK